MGKEYITSTVFISGHRDLTKEEFYRLAKIVFKEVKEKNYE